MRLRTHHEATLCGNQAVQAVPSFLQQRALGSDAQELLGVTLATGWPEAGAGSTGEDHGPGVAEGGGGGGGLGAAGGHRQK